MKFSLFTALSIALVLLLQLVSASASFNGYTDSPPTAHQVQVRAHPSASPSPRPGHYRRGDHKSRLERLVSDNRPAKRMVEVEGELLERRRVWGSKAKRS